MFFIVLKGICNRIKIIEVELKRNFLISLDGNLFDFVVRIGKVAMSVYLLMIVFSDIFNLSLDCFFNYLLGIFGGCIGIKVFIFFYVFF